MQVSLLFNFLRNSLKKQIEKYDLKIRQLWFIEAPKYSFQTNKMSRYLFSTYQINIVLRGVCLLAMSKFMLRKSLCKPKHRMLLFLSMFGGYLGKLETFHASVLFEMCLFRVTFLRYWSCCWCLQERYQLLGAWKNDISFQIEAQAVWQYLRVLLWQPSITLQLFEESIRSICRIYNFWIFLRVSKFSLFSFLILL